MSGITSTELKLPFKRKWIWIVVIIIALFAFGLFLLPSLDYQVEQRVAASVHMIPGAELRYNDTSERSGSITMRKFIYWINSPFEQVKDYPFVSNYREDSDPNRAKSFREITPNFSYRLYFLSDLPQKELDSMLYFAPSDLRDDPFHMTSVSFYIISANWVGDKGYFINELDYEHLAGKETSGTYIVYTYRVH